MKDCSVYLCGGINGLSDSAAKCKCISDGFKCYGAAIEPTHYAVVRMPEDLRFAPKHNPLDT